MSLRNDKRAKCFDLLVNRRINDWSIADVRYMRVGSSWEYYLLLVRLPYDENELTFNSENELLEYVLNQVAPRV